MAQYLLSMKLDKFHSRCKPNQQMSSLK